MDVEQQKGDEHHGGGGADGIRSTGHGSQQTSTAFLSQRALTSNLMEQLCDPKNLVRAYRRVRSNKGKPGVDGMTVHELADWLRKNSWTLTASLLDGSYRPLLLLLSHKIDTPDFAPPNGRILKRYATTGCQTRGGERDL